MGTETLDIQVVHTPESRKAFDEHALYLLGEGPMPESLAKALREERRERWAKRFAPLRRLFGKK